MIGYGVDLAFIHDAGFGELARAAAGVMVQSLRSRGMRGGLVVELGCGSGIGARELVRAGYRVIGIDLSPAMIRLARRNAPAARFQTGSLWDVELPRCIGITAIGESLNYRFEGGGRAALTRLFGRAWTTLEPGGVFLFDIAEPGQIRGASRSAKHASGTDWAVLVDAVEDPARGTMLRRITSFRRAGTLYRRTEECHRVRLYRAKELAAELRRIGFRARILRSYGDMRLRAAHAAIVCGKPREAI